ncbi:uncharacterized protein DSM5745_00662 [Aspergillus mulundensis]|uniref:Uncharacterized protein n=1 Tax=Aspergillus mulundensis TaxID=1810919 RepID=A0A3D8T481_9EURO|nr:hypothetical protein DSM5745_00662 [Aspergillus mulundensis]RDW93340.1 hypothetical protein DSM5745_00662 [Aspergillus mulundensis]
MHQLTSPHLYEECVIPILEHRLRDLRISSEKTWFNSDGSKVSFDAGECCETEPDAFKKILNHPAFMNELADNFRSLMHHFSEATLQNFSWHLGCCVPDEVMGPTGYIPLNQNCIQSLSLITDGTCQSSTDMAGLSQLNNLRSLTWEGIDPDGDHGNLVACLTANSMHLKHLKLGVVSRHLSDPDLSWLDDSELHINELTGLRGCELGKGKADFGCLRHLSLSNIALGNSTPKMAYKHVNAFVHLHELESFTLRQCPGTVQFLTGLTGSGRPFHLRRFECVYPIDENKTHPVEAFLQLCDNLEELYLSKRTSICFKSIPRTVKRLVGHFLTFNGALTFQSPLDYALEYSLQGLPLELVGISVFSRPWLMEPRMQFMNIGHTLRLIHLRATFIGNENSPCDLVSQLLHSEDRERTEMSNLSSFAEWAFDTNGLLHLQAIAYGNFAGGQQYAWTRILLCRNSSNEVQGPRLRSYRVMTRQEYEPLLDT